MSLAPGDSPITPSSDLSSLASVHPSIIDRDAASWLAFAFDPADFVDHAVLGRALELSYGLLSLRGWVDLADGPCTGLACDDPAPWWPAPLGSEAFTIRLQLSDGPIPSLHDLGLVSTLVSRAWLTEWVVLSGDDPLPDVVTTFLAPAFSVASLDVDRWLSAMERYRDGCLAPVPAYGCREFLVASDLYVRDFLGDGPLRPWSLGDVACVFHTPPGAVAPGDRARLYFALEDTSPDGDSSSRLRCATAGLVRGSSLF